MNQLLTVTLPLRWEEFDDGVPHHRIWTLKAGHFDVGEVFNSLAGWCWQFVGSADEAPRSGHPTLEAAKQGLIEAVTRSAAGWAVVPV